MKKVMARIHKNISYGQIVAFVLVLTICASLVSPLSLSARDVARDISQEVAPQVITCYDSGTAITSFEMDGIVFTLRTQDHDNGDVTLFEYQNHELIRSGRIYADRADRMYVTTYVQSDLLGANRSEYVYLFNDFNVSTQTDHELTSIAPNNQFGTGGNMGTVTFYTSYRNVPTLPVMVSFTNGHSVATVYTIRNQTATLLNWAGWFVVGLSIPAAIANPIAIWVIWGAGAALHGASFFIGHAVVGALRTTVTYTANNLQPFALIHGSYPRHNGSFQSRRYTINMPELPHVHALTFYPTFNPHDSITTPWGQMSFASYVHEIIFPRNTMWIPLAVHSWASHGWGWW